MDDILISMFFALFLCLAFVVSQLANSPNVSRGLASKNTNPLTSLARFFLLMIFSIFFCQLFSDLANENTAGECLEKLIHTPVKNNHNLAGCSTHTTGSV
jgi:hypothetical protein